MDDTPSVRELVRRILTENGYEVIDAGSGPEAIEVATSPGPDIDLLVTDVVMPKMTGPELAERTGLRTVFMSGHTAGLLPEEGLASGEVLFVQKPFTAPKLLSKVEQALSAH